MRAFYVAFPICDAVRHELSWTHYRILSRVEKKDDRERYMHMAAEESWNTRDLERNIRSGYLGRMLAVPTKYRLYLPDEEELAELIELDRKRLEDE